MVPNVGIDESARILMGNKDWSYDVPGFQFALMNEKTEWQPEGIIYINFNIGGTDGKEIAGRFYDIPMDEWHTATFLVDFQTEIVTFGYDGRRFTQSLREDINGGVFDPEPFIESLSTNSFRIGAPKAGDGQTLMWELFGSTTTDNIAELHLDNLRISSPRPIGDASIVSSAFEQLTSHMLGTSILDDAAAASLHSDIRNNLSGISFSEVEVSSKEFIATHNETNDPLYIAEEWAMWEYDNFPPASKAYVDLSLWMMREGLTAVTASLAEGITFQEHAIFPGAIEETAERVTGGSVDIRAQYIKDPYYNMGDMQVNEANELSSYVYRPTGFYAPAGELVRISVDQSLIDSGLHIRVGAHKYDHSLFLNTNRMPLIKVDYRIEAASFDVINPMGGGIYVLVPQETDRGWVNVQIDGAVRSPYFSYREGRETSLSEWASIREFPAPLADFESDKYMLTVPSDAIRSFATPDELMIRADEIMDTFQLVHGRPLDRMRAEAFMFDTRTSVEGSYPGGYPVTPGLWSQINGDIKLGSFSPFSYVNPGVWESNEGMFAMTHEMAHHHFGYALPHERETFVNVPFAMILNTVFQRDLDYSLKYSTYQRFSREDAAIDWMVTTNFRNGDPIGNDPTTDFQPEEVAYQARGSAKYLDLADIFGGWEALSSINRTFYEDDIASGIPVTYTSQPGVTRDHFLENGSTALGCNLASLFHFWGIHPSESTAAQLTAFPPCDGAIGRIKQYLSVAPRTNEDLRAFHAEKTATDIYQLKSQIYEPLMETFDSSTAQQIKSVGAELLETYFGVEIDDAPTKPILLNAEFSLLGTPSDPIRFSWTPSTDREDEPLSYSWRLFDSQTNETLVSKSWVTSPFVEIEVSELALALSPYSAEVDHVSLSQEVTTSDIFTIVTSEPLISYFRNGVGTNNDEPTRPVEFELDKAYPNPFNPATTIGYSIGDVSVVSLVVYDMLGRQVVTLVDQERRGPGRYAARFDASTLSSGTYIIKMTAGSFSDVRSIVLLK